MDGSSEGARYHHHCNSVIILPDLLLSDRRCRRVGRVSRLVGTCLSCLTILDWEGNLDAGGMSPDSCPRALRKARIDGTGTPKYFSLRTMNASELLAILNGQVTSKSKSELSPALQTFHHLLQAFRTRNVDLILSLRNPTCLREFLPKSLGYKPTTYEQYGASLKRLLPIFQNFELLVRDVVVQSQDNGIDVRPRLVAELQSGADTLAGRYENEYVWFIDFESPEEVASSASRGVEIEPGHYFRGPQIIAWKEYVDVGVNRDFYPKLQAAVKAPSAASP